MKPGPKYNNWRVQNYHNIKGLRPVKSFQVYDTDMKLIEVTPDNFLFSSSTKEPYTIYGSTARVHLPRSLCRRARIIVDIDTGEIKGTSAMYSVNK